MSDQHTLICSQESEHSPLLLSERDSAQAALLKSTILQARCSPGDGRKSGTTETSGTCQGDILMWLRRECLASLRAAPAICSEILTQDGCGSQPLTLSATYDLHLQSLRTSQHLLSCNEGEPSTEFFHTFTREGLMCGGHIYPLAPLVRSTRETDSLLLRTPTYNDGPGFYVASRKSAEGRVRDKRQLHWIHNVLLCRNLSKGWANPRFSELMMGLPTNHTALPQSEIQFKSRSRKSSPEQSTKS